MKKVIIKFICTFTIICVLLTQMQILSFASDENKALISENFSDYSSSQFSSYDKSLLFEEGKEKTLFQNSDRSWVMSSVNQGDKKTACAYYTNDRIYMYGGNISKSANVNLDIGDKKLDTVTRVTADIGTGGSYQGSSRNARPYINLFVNETESSYYTFGIGADKSYDAPDDAIKGYTPFVMKITNSQLDSKLGIISAQYGVGEDDKFGYGYETAHWDISIDQNNDIISWTVTLVPIDPKNSPYKAQTWSGSLTDVNISRMIYDARYPVSLGTLKNNMWYDNINIYGSYAKERIFTEFYDDFSQYDSTNSVNQTVRFENLSESMILAQNPSGVAWKTSTVNNGLYLGSGNGKAYIDQTNDRLAISGMGSWHLAAVNLDLGENVKAEKINNIEFTTTKGSRFQGLAMFVSSDENNFLAIGQRGSEELTGGFAPNDSSIYAPVLIKYLSGKLSVISFDDTKNKWMSTDSKLDWSISVDGNTISYSVVSNRNTSWSGEYTDTDNIINSKWRYPVAAVAIGDTIGYINNVKISYKEAEPNFYDKKEYTADEFVSMIETERQSGRNADLHDLISLNLSNVKGAPGSATVQIGGKIKDVSTNSLGVNIGLGDAERYVYDAFFNSDGSFKDEFISLSQKMHDVPTFRIGGTYANYVNMMKNTGPYNNREDSVWVSLPDDMLENNKIGNVSNSKLKMGLDEWLKVINEINPNATLIPCVSMLTMTPEDTQNLIEYLTGDENTYYGSMRIANGIKDTFDIDYIELTNEIDKKSRKDWYITEAKKQINAIRSKDPNIKIMICGTTAPYDSAWWEQPNGYMTQWIQPMASELGNIVDAVSFHQYYYGITPEVLLNNYVKNIENEFKKYNPDIKISFTEHAVNWPRNEVYRTTNFQAALYNFHNIQRCESLPYTDGMYLHCIVGSLWGYFTYDMLETPAEKMFKLLNDHLSGELLEADVDFSNDKSDWTVGNSNLENQIAVMAIARENGNISLVLSNFSPYNDINLSFDGISSDYKLTKEEVLTAPNAFVYTFDKFSEELVDISTNNYDFCDFDNYTLPSKSLVVLTLEKQNEYKELDIDFGKSTDYISASNTESVVCTDNCGTVWKTSAENNGMGKIIKNDYGKARISDNSLELSVFSQKPLYVNSDMSNCIRKIDKIHKITFSLSSPGENTAGISLCTLDGKNIYEFSNQLAGFDRESLSNWIISIEDNCLNWTARRSDGFVKTGSIATANTDNRYLISAFAYARKADTVFRTSNISDIKVFYTGEIQKQKYITSETDNDITINLVLSMYDSENLIVLCAFYNGFELLSVEKSDVNMVSDECKFTFAKPVSYTNAKIFIWNSLDELVPCESAIEFGKK